MRLKNLLYETILRSKLLGTPMFLMVTKSTEIFKGTAMQRVETARINEELKKKKLN